MDLPTIEQLKVFISYSWDSDSHKDRVLRLAARLRREGVDCELDHYVRHRTPPGGWPTWMANQIQDATFVLVVCTQTYERRALGKEEPVKGAGATWEGAIITQSLYESGGHSNKFLPVVFDQDDTHHIPIFLRGANRYNVSTPDGYDALYRHITNQPFVLKPAFGALQMILPLDIPPLSFDEESVREAERSSKCNVEPGSHMSESRDAILELVSRFEQPIRITVLKGVLDAVMDSTGGRALAQCLADGSLLEADGCYSMPNHADAHRPGRAHPLLKAMMLAAADGYAGYIRAHGRDHDMLDQQYENIWTALIWCVNNSLHAKVLPFIYLEKHVKWRGKKSELIKLGDYVINAANEMPAPHSDDVVMIEAKAHICGRAWVYQRIGRIYEAIAAAERAEYLDNSIPHISGRAFDRKCLGNLYRINGQLERAKELLSLAVGDFATTRGPTDIEVGDTKALMARAYLEAGEKSVARRIAAEAHELLECHPTSKDFADCNILLGDINRDTPDVARGYYEGVIHTIEEHRIERGAEPYAEAAFALGTLLARRQPDVASRWFEKAQEQYTKLEECEAAARAEWWRIQLLVGGRASRLEQQDWKTLNSEARGRTHQVIVRAWRRYEEQKTAAARPDRVGARSTAKNKQYWRNVLEMAENDIARVPDPWRR